MGINAKTYKYFFGEVELGVITSMPREVVRAKYPEGRIRKWDDFNLMVGAEVEANVTRQNFRPVTRMVCFKENGSRHKCGARCQAAKGHDCECECGGLMHGIAA
jgi:hypothetical protein